MIIYFRVDASLDIGSGHVMRCLALAKELHARGGNCKFICREHLGNLNNKIESEGFQVIRLPVDKDILCQDGNNYSLWAGSSWERDAYQCISSFRGIKPDILVVDHYGLDSKWERKLQSSCNKIFVIDDLANREHFCDYLVDQSCGRAFKDYKNLVPKNCTLFLGPKFALLRNEFSQLRGEKKKRKPHSIFTILVSMGGVDFDNCTLKVLRHIENDPTISSNVLINVVMGSQSPWINIVKDFAITMKCQVIVLQDVKNMARIMLDSHLSVGAGGITSIERCCMGLPSLIISLAENQVDGAKYLSRIGAAVYVGGIEAIDTGLSKALNWILSNKNLRSMSKNAEKITDGLGVKKIANHIFSEVV